MTIKQAIDHMETYKKSDLETFEKKYAPSEKDRADLHQIAKSTVPILEIIWLLDPVSACASILSMGVTLGQLTRDLDSGEAPLATPEKVKKDLTFSLSPADSGLLRSWLRDNLSSLDLSGDRQHLILEIFKQLQEQERQTA